MISSFSFPLPDHLVYQSHKWRLSFFPNDKKIYLNENERMVDTNDERRKRILDEISSRKRNKIIGNWVVEIF